MIENSPATIYSCSKHIRTGREADRYDSGLKAHNLARLFPAIDESHAHRSSTAPQSENAHSIGVQREHVRYDGLDRLSKLRFPVATKGAGLSSTSDFELYGYDAAGNRISLRKRDGRVLTYSFDALNRERVKTVPSSVSGAPGYSVYRGYDVRGLMTSARFSSDNGPGVTQDYDGFGRLRHSSSSMGGVTRTVTWDYEPGSNRRWITHPDGAYFLYEYDDAERLFHLSENGSATTLASLFYDTEGRRDELV